MEKLPPVYQHACQMALTFIQMRRAIEAVTGIPANYCGFSEHGYLLAWPTVPDQNTDPNTEVHMFFAVQFLNDEPPLTLWWKTYDTGEEVLGDIAAVEEHGVPDGCECDYPGSLEALLSLIGQLAHGDA
jgi:hypothetical protein